MKQPTWQNRQPTQIRNMGYCQQILSFRYFWWSLICNDFRTRYRRSFLGVVWSLARPVGMTCVLCVVFTSLFGGNLREYAPYLFSGVAIWQFLTESVIQGCRCFVQGSQYLRQHKIPALIFPLRTVLGSAIHLGISLAIALLLSTVLNGLPSLPALAMLVPGVTLLLCLALSLATICGLVHTHFPDTSHLLEIVLQSLYFLTPVIYPAKTFADNPFVSRLIKFNPLTSVLDLVRLPMLAGEFPSSWNWMMAGSLTMLAVTLAWWCMRKMERNLVFWV